MARSRLDFEVERTIKRAELTVFLCLLKKVIGSTKVHVYNPGIMNGLWKGEVKCTGPKAGDADLLINKNWEELHYLCSKEILIEVEHVTAHRTKQERMHMSPFDKFTTEGNEKADELAKEGAMLDVGFMHRQEQTPSSKRERKNERTNERKRERERGRGGVRSLAVCS